MRLLLFVTVVFYFWLLWDDIVHAKNKKWTPEFKEFCQQYMKHVELLPKYLSAGCCDVDHPTNDIMKQGWKGETLLICDGKEIV